MGVNIVVQIGGYQRGFLISLARLLAQDHNVTVITGPSLLSLIRRLAPELEKKTALRSDFKVPTDKESIIQECLQREERYGEKFSMISSHDRGLGKGYLFNVDKHPDMVESWWSHEDKLKKMLKDFVFFEHVISKHSPAVFIVPTHNIILSLVASHNNIPALAITNARMGSRYMWVENEFLRNSHLEAAINKYLEVEPDIGGPSLPDYQQSSFPKTRHNRIDYSYRGAISGTVRRLLRETYWYVRETTVRHILRRPRRNRGLGYRFAGWVGPLVRKSFNYKYFLKHGVKPEELGHYRVVYFPLHLEPEIALLRVSPEFNNSMEAIAWISKALPADVLLVVKEQPFSFGVRSRHFYDNLRRIGNVALAYPTVHPWDWIKAATVVATITGTAGIESVHFRKPVLSFGKHQVINHLATVRYAHDYETTRKSIAELLNLDPADSIFERTRQSLYLAQLESSFELPDFQNPKRNRDPKPELAKIAIEKLYEQYPEQFGRS